MRSWIRWGAVSFACFLLVGGLGYVAVDVAPSWFASPTPCRPGQRAFSDCLAAAKADDDDRRSVTTAFLALFAGAISVFGAYIGARTYAVNRDSARRSHELDRAGQITERFTRAIDQLGSASPEVRLGGIYALERIARDSEIDHPQVVEVLSAYVREHAPRRQEAREEALSEQAFREKVDATVEATQARVEALQAGPHASWRAPTQPPTDVRATMMVLARRNKNSAWDGEARLDLPLTDLRGLVLPEQATDLRRAILYGADLRNVGFTGGDLREAWMTGSDLRNAMLGKADLRDAALNNSDLRAAWLVEATLEGANLANSNLETAFLSRANLERAKYDDDTQWPEGFDPKAAGARHVDEAA